MSFLLSREKNINLQMIINNREVTQNILCCLNDVVRFKNNKYRWLVQDGYPTYEYSLYTLSKFMSFYIKYGTINKSIVYYLNEDILYQIGSVCLDVAKKLDLSRIVDNSEKYLSVVLEYYSVVDLIKKSTEYAIKQLNKSGIEAWLSKSQSSYSMYIKPDLILKSLRISNHVSKDHTRCLNIICCREVPNTSQDELFKNTPLVYVTEDTYKKEIDDWVSILKSDKEELIKSRSPIEYDRMKNGTKNKMCEKGCNYKKVTKLGG